MLNSFDLAILALLGATLVAYGYTTYTAIAIRHTIAGRIYRKQALGVAFVAIIYALNSSTSLLPTPSIGTLDFYTIFSAISFPLTFITIFYWVDSSVLAARYSDPLLRDTLHWHQARYLIWAINILTTAFPLSFLFYLQVATGGIPTDLPVWLFWVFLTPAYVSVGSGAVVLPIMARRSKDKTLRRHLEWFGVYLGFLFVFSGLVGNALGFYSFQLSTLFGGVVNVAGSFFLYRSARSLIALYKFSSEEEASLAEQSKSGLEGLNPSWLF